MDKKSTLKITFFWFIKIEVENINAYSIIFSIVVFLFVAYLVSKLPNAVYSKEATEIMTHKTPP